MLLDVRDWAAQVDPRFHLQLSDLRRAFSEMKRRHPLLYAPLLQSEVIFLDEGCSV